MANKGLVFFIFFVFLFSSSSSSYSISSTSSSFFFFILFFFFFFFLLLLLFFFFLLLPLFFFFLFFFFLLLFFFFFFLLLLFFFLFFFFPFFFFFLLFSFFFLFFFLLLLFFFFFFYSLVAVSGIKLPQPDTEHFLSFVSLLSSCKVFPFFHLLHRVLPFLSLAFLFPMVPQPISQGSCCYSSQLGTQTILVIARAVCDGTSAETRFGFSAKQTSPFKSAGVSVQSTTGSRGVRISGQLLYYL